MSGSAGTTCKAKGCKLICTDVDGTLLNSENEMMDSTKKAIQRASEAGIPIAITTGKSPTGTWQEAIKPHLPSDTPCLFCQGALLTDTNGNIINQECIQPDHIKRVLAFGEEHKLTVAAYIGAEADVVAKEQNEWTKKHLPAIKEMEPRGVGSLHDYLLKEGSPKANKLAFLDKPERIEEVLSKAQEALGDDLTVMITLPGILECIPKNATKGDGVEKLLKHLKIDRKEMFALGDGSNDKTFLKLAGVAVAMGNGKDVIKDIADWTAPSNDEDGWAAAVNKLLDGDFASKMGS